MHDATLQNGEQIWIEEVLCFFFKLVFTTDSLQDLLEFLSWSLSTSLYFCFIRKGNTSVSEMRQDIYGSISWAIWNTNNNNSTVPLLALWRHSDTIFFLTWDERFENWSLVQMEHALLSRYKWTTNNELYCFGSGFFCHMKALYSPVMWVIWEEGLHFPLFSYLHIFHLRKRFFAYLCSACWKPHAEASALA